MKNEKIKLFEVEQVNKMRENKITNKIAFKKDKFYKGDFVHIELKLLNTKGELYTKNYISGIVIKGNTKKTKSDNFVTIDKENIKANLQKYAHLKPSEYITIGSILNASNRLSMKVCVNQPNINITVERAAKRKTGALVKGTGRNNVIREFMNDKTSVVKLKKMFKNTLHV